MSSKVAGFVSESSDFTTFFVTCFTGVSSNMISASRISASSTSSSSGGASTVFLTGSASGVRVSSSSKESTTSSSSSGVVLASTDSVVPFAGGSPTSSFESPDSSNRFTSSLFFPEVAKSLRMHNAFSFATVNVDATSSLMTEPQPSPVAYPFQGWRSMCALNVQFRTRIDSALNLREQRSFHLGP